MASDWTSGIRHCGLSEPRRTGAKMKEGSSVDFSTRYSRHTSDRTRLSFVTMIPPTARAKRKNGGKSQ